LGKPYGLWRRRIGKCSVYSRGWTHPDQPGQNLKPIAEVQLHDHVLLQCLDMVLGAMTFRLNDKHKEKPPGKHRRGKRTIAKERLYMHIRTRICQLYPNFDIGETTGKGGDWANVWIHPYRHWKFVPTEQGIDPTKTKK
jgi:hypothetical protein